MNKKILISISLLLLTFVTYSQNAIPNPGFENWLSGEPTGGWGSLNGIQPGSSTQATGVDAHNGNSAVKLTSLFNSTFGGTLLGAIGTGVINLNTFNLDYGIQFNLLPDSLVGWYKYTPTNNDVGEIDGILTRWNGSQRDTVAKATFNMQTIQATYIKFKAEFNYLLSGNPDTLQIILATGQVEVNNQLWVDDLGLVYNPSVGLKDDATKQYIDIYPNPVTENLFVDISGIKNSNLIIYDVTGKKSSEYNLENKINKINVSNFAKGLYVYQIINENNNELKIGKFIVR